MAMLKATQQLLLLSKISTAVSRTLNSAFQNRNYINTRKRLISCFLSNVNHQHTFRQFNTSAKLCSNYEGDGKTTVTSLNREYKHLVMIDSYSSIGFRLNNGVYAIGPIAAFPRTILHWNVNTVEELTIESISLFHLLDPKIDILIFGSGNSRIVPNKEITDHLKSCKICLEVLPTDKAISLFNFLNAEGRCVAGAFIPPTSVVEYEDELKLLGNVDAIDDYRVPPHNKIEV